MRPASTMGRRAAGVALGLVLTTAPLATAATTAALLRCQKGIHTRAASFVKLVETALGNCAQRVESCQLAQELDGEDPTQCLAAATASCGVTSAKLASARSSYTGKALVACGVSLADLAPYVGGGGFFGVSGGCGAASMSDLMTCVFGAAQCSAERTLFTLDARAQDALSAAGIGAAHPCVAP